MAYLKDVLHVWVPSGGLAGRVATNALQAKLNMRSTSTSCLSADDALP